MSTGRLANCPSTSQQLPSAWPGMAGPPVGHAWMWGKLSSEHFDSLERPGTTCRPLHTPKAFHLPAGPLTVRREPADVQAAFPQRCVSQRHCYCHAWRMACTCTTAELERPPSMASSSYQGQQKIWAPNGAPGAAPVRPYHTVTHAQSCSLLIQVQPKLQA